MTRVATHGAPAVGVMMLDLDHFKMVNDQHGHQVGDDVLQATGAAIAGAMRAGDIVMRYGGEEFLIAIADVDERTLTASASASAAASARSAWSTPAAAASCPSRQAWGSRCRRRLTASNRSSQRADRALYAAKAAGRDRVVFQPAPELPAIRA